MNTVESIIDEVDDENNYSRTKIQGLLNLNEESVNVDTEINANSEINKTRSIKSITPLVSDGIDTLRCSG